MSRASETEMRSRCLSDLQVGCGWTVSRQPAPQKFVAKVGHEAQASAGAFGMPDGRDAKFA
jgi:hypothetical protein